MMSSDDVGSFECKVSDLMDPEGIEPEHEAWHVLNYKDESAGKIKICTTFQWPPKPLKPVYLTEDIVDVQVHDFDSNGGGTGGEFPAKLLDEN